MVSEVIHESLKLSIGQVVGFFDEKNFYFEGKILAVDDEFLKYLDRKQGVKIISLDKIKEVSLK